MTKSRPLITLTVGLLSLLPVSEAYSGGSLHE